MSSHHGLYAQGYTRATMGGTKGRYLVTGCQSQKTPLSSDCRLQLACMKLESLVIVDQQRYGECFRTLYTPPVKPWKPGGPEAGNREEPSRVKLVTGAKS